MINIEDSLIQFLPKISDASFKTYVVLKRYFTESIPIPLDKLPKILSLPDSDSLYSLLQELEKASLIKFSRTARNSCPIFLIHDKLSSSVVMLSYSTVADIRLNGEVKKSRVKPLDSLIPGFTDKEYVKKLEKMRKNLELEASKEDFEKVFKKIEAKRVTFLAEYITNKFSDILIKNSNYQAKLTSKWRMFQLSSARALVKDYPKFEKDDWDDVLDFFFDEESYWKDKTDSIKTIRNHMLKYFNARNRGTTGKSALSSSMEVIK